MGGQHKKLDSSKSVVSFFDSFCFLHLSHSFSDEQKVLSSPALREAYHWHCLSTHCVEALLFVEMVIR